VIVTQLADVSGLRPGETTFLAMGRAPAAAAPIPDGTLTPDVGTADQSVGQLAAQRSSAVPTRAHQSGGQPNPDCPAHGQHPTRSPPRWTRRGRGDV